MLVRFNEISPCGNQYELFEITENRHASYASLGDGFHAACILQKKSGNKAELKGELKVKPLVVCDRCLDTFACHIQADFHLFFEVLAGNDRNVREIECGPRELDTIFLESPEIDVHDILQQQIELSLPHKRICTANCKGLCSQCGKNKNKEDCFCPETELESPFAVLSKLKK